MRKLQLFIIILSVLLASYACAADLLIKVDVNRGCVDFGRSFQGALWAARHNSPEKTFLFSELSGYPYMSVKAGSADIKLDTAVDTPEDGKINNHGVTLSSRVVESAPILTVRCSRADAFHFPSEAFRLRI